jgi:FkbM family methyltransferase
VLRRLRQANVTVHPVALSDREGEERLYVPVFDGKRLDALASLIEPKVPHDVLSIQLRPLDSLLGDEPGGVQFIKCDAEGHEFAVLQGGRSVLSRTPILLIRVEERHQRGTIPRTFSYLKDLGYVGYFLRGRSLHPLEEFDIERDQLAFLTESFVPYAMPAVYVNNFLFVSVGVDVTSLLAG